MSFHRCSGCHRIRSECEAKYLKCSRCLSSRYCSKDCQRGAWKDHKEECCKLGMKKIATEYGVQQPELDGIWIPEALRLAHSQNILPSVDPDRSRTEIGTNPDTIYYILRRAPHVHEMLGPYYPVENLVKAFKYLLATECSLADAPIFEDTFAAIGVQEMPPLVAILPFADEDDEMDLQTFTIVQRTNRPVATKCRDGLPTQPRQLYNVVCTVYNSQTGATILDLLDTATSISDANESARKAIEKWDVTKPDNIAKVKIQRNGLLYGAFALRYQTHRILYNVYGVPIVMEEGPPMPLAHIANHAALRAMAAKALEYDKIHGVMIRPDLQMIMTTLRDETIREDNRKRSSMPEPTS